MEYAKLGELFNLIIKRKRLEELEAAYFYSQLICGIEEIHKNLIVHRDIKPENLLLKEDNTLTIIDFGLSNQYKNGEYLKTSCGSPCYAAPEMIMGIKYNGILVDLWSSGIVLYAMVCGYLPFEDKNNDDLYKKILSGKYYLPDFLSDNCKDLIKKILVVNPSKRIHLEDIKNHPFLKPSIKKYYSILNFDYNFINNLDNNNTKNNSQHNLNPINKNSLLYDEFNIKEKKYLDVIIDKMVNEFNFRKDDIIFNLSHNKHNNITTTYELLLKKHIINCKNKYKINNNNFFSNDIKNITATTSQQSISINTNTTSSPIKDFDYNNKNSYHPKNKNSINNNNTVNKCPKSKNSKDIKKQSIKNNLKIEIISTQRNDKSTNNNNYYNNSNNCFFNKTIDSPHNNKSYNSATNYSSVGRKNFSKNHNNKRNNYFNDFNNKSISNNMNNNNNMDNDISNSLDVSKIIKKNKFDSNNLITIQPKLITVNRKIFTNLNNAINKNLFEGGGTVRNNFYNNHLPKCKYKKGINGNSKQNLAIDTSVTYEQSPRKFNNLLLSHSGRKPENKKILYIPNEAINLDLDSQSNNNNSINNNNNNDININNLDNIYNTQSNKKIKKKFNNILTSNNSINNNNNTNQHIKSTKKPSPINKHRKNKLSLQYCSYSNQYFSILNSVSNNQIICQRSQSLTNETNIINQNINNYYSGKSLLTKSSRSSSGKNKYLLTFSKETHSHSNNKDNKNKNINKNITKNDPIINNNDLKNKKTNTHNISVSSFSSILSQNKITSNIHSNLNSYFTKKKNNLINKNLDNKKMLINYAHKNYDSNNINMNTNYQNDFDINKTNYNNISSNNNSNINSNNNNNNSKKIINKNCFNFNKFLTKRTKLNNLICTRDKKNSINIEYIAASPIHKKNITIQHNNNNTNKIMIEQNIHQHVPNYTVNVNNTKISHNYCPSFSETNPNLCSISSNKNDENKIIPPLKTHKSNNLNQIDDNINNTNYYSNNTNANNNNNYLSIKNENNSKNPKTPNKKRKDIKISIKTANEIAKNNINNNRYNKKYSNLVNRPISPVTLFTNQKFLSTNNNNNNYINTANNKTKSKPTIVGIDIANNNNSSINSNNNSNLLLNKKKPSASNSQKKIKSISNTLTSKNNSSSKNKNKNSKDTKPLELKLDLEENLDIKNKILTQPKDFALCTTTSTYDEILQKLKDLCIKEKMSLTLIENEKFICKKHGDNTINMEISKVGSTNILKLYHLNGVESITKNMIKTIINNIGF